MLGDRHEIELGGVAGEGKRGGRTAAAVRQRRVRVQVAHEHVELIEKPGGRKRTGRGDDDCRAHDHRDVDHSLTDHQTLL